MTMLVLAEGTLFAGRYRVIRCMARGGMGAVYEVLHVETERRRALKVMLPHLVASDELRQRFRQEARVAARVESAFIVDVFDAGIDDETKMPFLVMELLRGEEIGRRLARMGHFSFTETVAFLWQTALALDKTHAARIVHRDLKPENLFLAEQEDGPARIKVLDFGIAKLVAEQGTQANATQSIGTPMYMAPEQFLSGSKVSPATDIFSLGMMAYTLLVGSPYWREEKEKEGNVYSFIAAVMSGPVEAATARAARQGIELPAMFNAWFARVTASDPRNRFGAATEAITALARALGVSEPIVGAAGPMTGQPSRRAEATTMPDPTTAVFYGKTPTPVRPTTHPTDVGLSSSHPSSHGDHSRGSSWSKLSGSRAPLIAMVAFAVLVVGLVVVVGVSIRTVHVDPAPASPNLVATSAAPTPSTASSPVPVVVPAPALVASMATPPQPSAEMRDARAATPPHTTSPRAPAPKPAPAPAPAPTKPVPAPKPTSTWGD